MSYYKRDILEETSWEQTFYDGFRDAGDCILNDLRHLLWLRKAKASDGWIKMSDVIRILNRAEAELIEGWRKAGVQINANE
jgi:hypothetical protein